MTEPAAPDFDLPLRIKAAMYFRLLALQGSWNYETLLGTGVGFVMEPALRLLPGGLDGQAYRAALARESRYFNAHPYLAGVAVGALTRAELGGVDPVRIERFRTALAGPLGSVGDRLVWASWLPFCSLVAIGVYGAGGSARGPRAARLHPGAGPRADRRRAGRRLPVLLRGEPRSAA